MRHRKCRHHRISDGLDDGAGFGRDDLVQDLEMSADQIIGHEIADALVEFRSSPSNP